jgi:IS6 family transposase
MRTRRPRPAPAQGSAFAGFRFPPEVIVLGVRWYVRFGLMPHGWQAWMSSG